MGTNIGSCLCKCTRIFEGHDCVGVFLRLRHEKPQTKESINVTTCSVQRKIRDPGIDCPLCGGNPTTASYSASIGGSFTGFYCGRTLRRSSSRANGDASGRWWSGRRTDLATNTGVVGSIGSGGCGVVDPRFSIRDPTPRGNRTFTGTIPGGDRVKSVMDWTIFIFFVWENGVYSRVCGGEKIKKGRK